MRVTRFTSAVLLLAVLCGTTTLVSAGDPKPGELGNEIADLDFGKLIGGPLKAVVQAQAESSLATIDFIMKLGTTDVAASTSSGPSTQKSAGRMTLKYVSFKYNKQVPELDKETNLPTGKSVMSQRALKVPLLAIVPIPNLEIEEVSITFNAKVGKMTTSDGSKDVSTSNKLSQSYRGGNKNKAAMQGAFSDQKKEMAAKAAEFGGPGKGTSTGTSSSEFSLKIIVKARQAPMPAGLAKVLDMLQIAMSDTTKIV